MDDLLSWSPIDWPLVVSHLAHIGIAYVFALPVAWDRERHSVGAGLRTFPLVAVGSCAYLLIGLSMLEGSASHARLLYGLMTGIGFIGGGSILKEGNGVSGTATAASIWNTGAIGAAVAWQRYEIALVLCLLNVLTLRLFQSVKRYAHPDDAEASEDQRED